MTTNHEGFMAEAVAEASKGLGRTRPNPPVGCVIVRDGQVVARGHHKKAGGPHAEVHALRALTHPGEECELYVTLEPCCTHGRTPPCSDAILGAGIRRVFDLAAQMPDPINLSIGQPDFDVPQAVQDAAAQLAVCRQLCQEVGLGH